MGASGEELSWDELIERIATLADQLAEDDPALELLDYLEVWHREGILRLATAIPPEALADARTDPVVAHLLDAYLGEDDEDDPEAVVEEALEEIRPYVHSHGGEMAVVGISDGIVTLSLMGSCDGCPASSLTLTQGVEQVLRQRWPGFCGLRVEGRDRPRPGPQQLLQIQSLRRG